MEALSQVLKLFVFSSLKGKDVEPHEPELKCGVCEVIWIYLTLLYLSMRDGQQNQSIRYEVKLHTMKVKILQLDVFFC